MNSQSHCGILDKFRLIDLIYERKALWHEHLMKRDASLCIQQDDDLFIDGLVLSVLVNVNTRNRTKQKKLIT